MIVASTHKIYFMVFYTKYIYNSPNNTNKWIFFCICATSTTIWNTHIQVFITELYWNFQLQIETLLAHVNAQGSKRYSWGRNKGATRTFVS